MYEMHLIPSISIFISPMSCIFQRRAGPPRGVQVLVCKAHLAKGRAVKTEKQAQLSSESALDDLWVSLQSANACIAELENELTL